MAVSPHSSIAVLEVRRNIKNPNKDYSETEVLKSGGRN
jgi:hypothetical protein